MWTAVLTDVLTLAAVGALELPDAAFAAIAFWTAAPISERMSAPLFALEEAVFTLLINVDILFVRAKPVVPEPIAVEAAAGGADNTLIDWITVTDKYVPFPACVAVRIPIPTPVAVKVLPDN